MRNWNPLIFKRAADLRRLFFSLVDVQTEHLQPIMGTPIEAPVPKKSKDLFMGEIIPDLPNDVHRARDIKVPSNQAL